MISRSLGFGGKIVSLKIEDVVRQYGDAGRYGVTSNSLVSAVNARRLGWLPKAPSLSEYLKSCQIPVHSESASPTLVTATRQGE